MGETSTPYKEHSTPQGIQIVWGDTRTAWDMGDERTIPYPDMQHAIEHYFGEENPLFHDIPLLENAHTLSLWSINEGFDQGIFLAQTDTEKQFVFVVAKDTEHGNLQTARDHGKLIDLKSQLAVNPMTQDVFIPERLSPLLEIPVPNKNAVYASCVELIPDVIEISCGKGRTAPFVEYHANVASLDALSEAQGTTRPSLPGEQAAMLSQILPEQLARLQTLTHFLIGSEEPNRINNGTFVSQVPGEDEFQFGITTIFDTELRVSDAPQPELRLAHFTLNLLLHDERSLNDEGVASGPEFRPFLLHAHETLRGIEHAARDTGNEQVFEAALPLIAEMVYTGKIPIGLQLPSERRTPTGDDLSIRVPFHRSGVDERELTIIALSTYQGARNTFDDLANKEAQE